MASVAEAIKEVNYIPEKKISIAERGVAIAEKVQKITENEVFNELLKIDIPEYELLDAFLFLIKSQQKIRAFLGVPAYMHKELGSKMMVEAKDP